MMLTLQGRLRLAGVSGAAKPQLASRGGWLRRKPDQALRLSSALPLKHSSLAVMARSHGDERCLHPQELSGQGITVVPGHIPSSILSFTPPHWCGPHDSSYAHGRAASLQPAPAWM